MSMFDFSKMADAANKLDEFMRYVRDSIEEIKGDLMQIGVDLDGISNRLSMIEEGKDHE